VNTSTNPLAEQFQQFGKAQLAEVSTRDLRDSTVHLILATAFFTGAAIGMAKLSDAPRKIYLRTLRIFLEKRFGLNADHATGLVESNARLYKRYVLIERIYNAGLLAANDWCKHDGSPADELNLLLKKYHDLSMSGLGIEGTKEQKIAPPEVEAIAKVEAPVVIAPPPTRWGRRLFLLMLIALLGLIGYAAVFPEHIPAPLLDMLPAEYRDLLFSMRHSWR
jgi:hypothetical protein